MNDSLTVCITGGTGFLGTALTRYLLDTYPSMTVRIISRGEHRQADMQQAFAADRDRLRFFLGDVRDYHRLLLAFRGADIVIHAAALKRQDMLEYNVFEGVATNVNGTYQVTLACSDSGIKRCIFISSDKAVEASTSYGATKQVAELLTIQANAYSPHGTQFEAVRWGNVAASTGSVIPFWRKCLQAGKPLPITDSRSTRFWIAVDDAVRLVDLAMHQETRGMIYVPHIPAFTVGALATAVINEYSRDGHTEVVGLRPAEKKHEALMTVAEQERAVLVPWESLCCYGIVPLARTWEIDASRDYPHAEFSSVYRSDVWPWRMTADDLQEALRKECSCYA